METTSLPPAWERKVVGSVVSVWQGRRRGGPWLPPAHLRWEPLTVEGFNGATLSARWFPAENPRATVVLAHPARRYGKHWFEREGWVDFLHRHDLDVMSFDFAGWGESRGRPYHVADLERVVDEARRWSGGQPVSVIGVSMGAFMGVNAASRMDLDGLVLESPYPTWVDWYRGRIGWITAKSFETVFPRTTRYLHAELNAAATRARRVLVVAAGEDELTAPALTERVARAFPAGVARHLVVPGARHLEPFAKSEEYRQAILQTIAP